jgi:hypothetical protein
MNCIVESQDAPPIEPVSDHALKIKARMSLVFKNMDLRRRTIGRPAIGTCTWPMGHRTYQGWITRREVISNHGLLQITGHPGSGKSVLMKYLASTCPAQSKCLEDHVATFFFDSGSLTSEARSMRGLLQSLLFQLLPHCNKALERFSKAYSLKVASEKDDSSPITWEGWRTTGHACHFMQ